jgi:hypothetical protein
VTTANCLCINNDGNAIMTRAITPAWWWQWCHCNEGNYVIATTAKMPGLRRHLRIEDGNTIATTAITPAWQQQRCLCIDDGKEPIVKWTTTPAQWLHLLDYGRDAIAMRATNALQLWQRCLRINGNNTIATMTTTPSQWQQGCLHIDDDNDAIATRVTTPAWGWQQCHCKEGNNAIADQGHQHHCYEGDNTISTTARMPGHWQWQWHHCHEGNSCNCNNGKDTCASMATMPLQQGQQCHHNDGKDACASMMTTLLWQGQQCQLEDGNNANAMRATMPLQIKGDNAIVTRAITPAWQWQGCLRINNSRDTIAMRGTIAIATTAKMPVHQRQWRHCNKGNNAIAMMARTPAHWWWWQHHCNEGNDASLRTAMTILQQGQQSHRGSRAMMPLLQGWQHKSW